MEALFYACFAAGIFTVIALYIYSKKSKRRFEIDNFDYAHRLEQLKTEARQRDEKERQQRAA